MIKAKGYAAKHSFSSLAPIDFERSEPGEKDVHIEILYCGVCHSDIHQAKNEWKNTVYPCLPGHEIVGRVKAVGPAVSQVKIGDIVGVGCMIDSCRHCDSCKADLEQYCQGPKGATMTYNGPMKPDGTNTFGGYSDSVVVPEHFVLNIPGNLDLKGVAPLLCAGVTTYSPLRHWKVHKGQHVAVVGLGGLGHMAIKLAAAIGAHVTVISTSAEKEADARRLGAEHFILSTEKEAMKDRELGFDFILSTIPESHDINPYVKLLKREGTLAVVGALTPFAKPTDNTEVAFHRRTVAGSLIGGIAETQEVLNFCGEHNIVSDVEMIAIDQINEAFKRVEKGDVRYRFVIDIAGSLKKT
jgi:uncharacterized zinc-type alcohol dehydrogenase-like protein